MKKLCLYIICNIIVIKKCLADIESGFYIGQVVGYGSMTASAHHSYPPFITQTMVDVGVKSSNIAIIGGYGLVMKSLYMGTEIGYTFEKITIHYKEKLNFFHKPLTLDISLNRSGYTNISLRGGYLFTPTTMGYLRMGVNLKTITLNDNISDTFCKAPSVMPGIGLEKALTDNIYLRIEYVCEFSPSINTNHLKVSNINVQYSKIALSYKF